MARGNSVAILVHRRELLHQASRALTALDVRHARLEAGRPTPSHRVIVASVQTLARRLRTVAAPDLVVIDESHHVVAGTWRRIADAWPDAWTLGVTATPERLDGRGLDEAFDALVLGPSMRELISGGYLAEYVAYAPPREDLSSLRKRMGDVSQADAAAALDRPRITGDVIDHYRRLGGGQRAIVFATLVEHAQNVAAAFAAAGIPAESIDGTLPQAQRDAVLARFAAGTTRVLTSCEIVSEGFDLPAAGCAILLRPTLSLTVYLQQVGRVLRPSGERAVILDHVGNVEKHGLPDAPRAWALAGRPKGDAPPPVKRCLSCFALVAAGARLCPECGSEFRSEQERRPPEQADGHLVEVAADAGPRTEAECHTLADWHALARRKGYKPGWAYYRFRERLRKGVKV
jgi:superfamily II DNA or RNA helicase